MTTRILPLLVAAGAIVACAGGPGTTTGASSSSSSSSSSSGSSSGDTMCGATCQSSASIAFDESNANARLDGAFIVACHRDLCAKGDLTKSDAGAEYRLTLKGEADGGPSANVYATVAPSTAAAGSLRFSFHFQLAYSGPEAPADGDVYRIEARAGEGGQVIFDRSFTATYRNETVCGTQCKVYDAK